MALNPININQANYEHLSCRLKVPDVKRIDYKKEVTHVSQLLFCIIYCFDISINNSSF